MLLLFLDVVCVVVVAVAVVSRLMCVRVLVLFALVLDVCFFFWGGCKSRCKLFDYCCCFDV